MTKTLLTVNEAASECRLTHHTIREWIAKRKIGVVRLGRAVRIPATEITRLMEQGSVPAIRERDQ